MNIDVPARIGALERRMDTFSARFDSSVASLSTQILQSRDEMRVSVSAIRGDMTEMEDRLERRIEASVVDSARVLRGDMTEMEDRLERRIEASVAESVRLLRGEMAEMKGSLEGTIAASVAETVRLLSAAIAEGDEASRRYMLILHEEVLDRITRLGEARP